MKRNAIRVTTVHLVEAFENGRPVLIRDHEDLALLTLFIFGSVVHGPTQDAS